MIRSKFYTFFLVFAIGMISCSPSATEQEEIIYPGPEPYTRWWWFASEFSEKDIKYQLDWIKEHGFGGVEVAFIYPVNRNPDAKRFEWLGEKWQDRVVFAKNYCNETGLGCDFTFGTLWPFGGTFVPDEDRTRVYGDSTFKQPLRLSWTHPDTGNVIDHLSEKAFTRYAGVMGEALAPALGDHRSALFCDSWEVETHRIWTPGLEKEFMEKYGYDIIPFMESIYDEGNEGPLYDYMKLVSEKVINEFYIPFSRVSHKLGAYSRVQCAGSPTDLISSYSVVDIPESEAMLYNPHYSRIVGSAAALSDKPLVSAESFTCLYGWPREHMHEEKITDLKLVADALFANGVNHIIWHGMPFNPKGIDTIYFYASVHVGKRGSLNPHLEKFNVYLTNLAKVMRKGHTYSQAAVYLPVEDSWIGGEMPEELQLPWAWGEYEMRHVEFPEEVEGYSPLWINGEFLGKGKVEKNKLVIGENRFDFLYVDVDHMDIESVKTILDLARQGLPVCLKKEPKQAGHIKSGDYKIMMNELTSLPNCSGTLQNLINEEPLLKGEYLPDHWCRKEGDSLFIFFANPAASQLLYPVPYGISDTVSSRDVNLALSFDGMKKEIVLNFETTSSLLVKIVPGIEPEIISYNYK